MFFGGQRAKILTAYSARITKFIYNILMHVILTHEQADFDALASLFGAYLLDEKALPVLPRRMNRNLRAFLTLYGAEFPFVDPRDLPQKSIKRVLLVDTQSLVTLKGMGDWTEVRVIDHHPRRAGLPDTWQFTYAPTGATTTVLVEAMQAHNGHLSMIQATLLLLGIYEDTGALTYSSTTSRDVRAAAYLLELGASLQIAVDFLNPPLSPDQRRVYESLVSSAQTYEIAGRRIVIAGADATGLSEEISTLAHKLRDLLDPDALFVLVRTDDGVRMVARSTTDQIDVAAVAAQFGGGGHDRAAAALIRPDKEPPDSLLFEIRDRLLEILPRFVRPLVTVAQIMSNKPRLLDPETPAQEVARLMQRYGYEGFPVVKDGRVLGLLTRRAVDRALAHKLNLTAASLMDAGSVTVRPEDSLETLQARMTDSGWGQIPVVDESGAVIGIVTRTDLLKTLLPGKKRPERRSLTSKLENALPPERLALVRLVAAEAEAQGLAVYVVGGFVRDLLLGRPSLDFDIVVEGDAILLARALSAKHGGRFTSHTRFGTAKWFLPPGLIVSQTSSLPTFVDLISARQEYYEHPTALPTVERGSIKLDLHRRDFTINTLALRLDGRHFGELYDYWGGLADLERGLVRVLHSLSFVDDPTRMIRAVRFEQRFGFQIEARTLQLMDEARPLLDRLTSERIRHEFDLILDEPNAPAMLSRLADLHLLAAIRPNLPWNETICSRLEEHLSDSVPNEWLGSGWTLGGLPSRRALGYLLWLFDQPLAVLNRIINRLRLTAPLARALRLASALWADLPSLVGTPPSVWTGRLDGLPLPAVYAVYCAAEGDARANLEQYALIWRHVQPRTDGHVLQSLGVPPGPAYQNLLRRLLYARLDGEVTNDEEEEALLKRLLSELSG